MASETTKLQVNLKSPAGSLLNIYAEDQDDLNTQLDSLIANLPKINEAEALIGAVQTVNNTFSVPKGSFDGTAPVGTPNYPGPAQAQPAQQAQAAPQGSPQQYQGFFLDPRGWLASTPGDIQICSHGPYEYKSGLSGPNSKNPGQPYEMYVCRAPKNGGPGLDGVFAPQHPTQSKPRQWGSR